MRLRGNDGRERLLSALGQPSWPRYRGVAGKAAALHFFLNKGHPFVDGNKRFAVAAMELFIDLNGHGLVASDQEVVDLALGVADGSTTMAESAAFLRQRLFNKGLPNEQLRAWLEDLDTKLRKAGSPETLGAGIRRHRRITSAIVNTVLMSEEWTALFEDGS
ncbi:MAG: type II toxin-antitoxin system death-on-curing family toxin [Dehalococcoidia bacterium]|nr:MAG: type II toxin-antitoxin system death-on-curing family toxin [Dehalococcoidia bacterium]